MMCDAFKDLILTYRMLPSVDSIAIRWPAEDRCILGALETMTQDLEMLYDRSMKDESEKGPVS